MKDRIPAVKLSPRLMREILAIIDECKGHRHEMDLRIHEVFKRESKKLKPPSLKNATRAVTYPTLRHLDLIQNEGANLELKYQGRHLVSSSREGTDQYVRALARHLLEWDRDTRGPRLLEEINQLVSAGRIARVEELVRRIWPQRPIAHESLEKLNRLLSFYEEAGLVHRSEGRIRLNEGQIRAAESAGSHPPNAKEFVQTLADQYSKLVHDRKSPTIPIPMLEQEVCKALSGRLWPGEQFRKYLIRASREPGNLIIHFSEPMMKEGKGIRIGDRYFYYVQIHRRD